MKKGIVSAFLSIVIILVVAVMFNNRGPNLDAYQHLKDPAVRTMQARKVLVVEATGEPDRIGKNAFGLLFRTYYGNKGIPKIKELMAPRARWPLADAVPESQWIGRYALALPDTVKDVKLPDAPEGLSIKTDTWEYGEVAEILHLGPYDSEKPAIERLRKFIADKGYDITGEHEEEYLRGPGILIPGNPAKYVTIIRYRITPKETAADEKP